LLGISKRGDTYLRTLLIHGRAIVRVATKYQDRRNKWIDQLEKRRGNNIAAVVVANKNARIVWALLMQANKFSGDYDLIKKTEYWQATAINELRS